MERSRANFLTLIVSAEGQSEATSEVFTAGPFEEMIDRFRPGLAKRAPTDILPYAENLRDLTPGHEVAQVFRIGEDDADRRLVGLEKAGILDRFEWAGSPFWTARKLALDKLPLEVVKISHVPPEARIEIVTDLTPIVTTAVQNLYTEVARESGKAYHFPLGLEARRFV